MSQPTPPSAPPPTVTYYVCDNCPTKPRFLSVDELARHCSLTHTVPMVITEEDPWGQRPPRTRKLYHVEEISLG